MCVDAHIPSSAGQTLVFSVRYVLVCSWVNKLFRQTKVYYMNYVVFFAGRPTDEEILRLDIAVNEIL